MGGTNEKENLVLLTAKEHFVCHHLLTLFTQGKDKEKMYFAFFAMCNQTFGDVTRNYKIYSRTYEYAKIEFSKVNSKLHSGKKLSQKHIDVIKERMRGPWNQMLGKKGSLNPLFGKQRTKQTIEKIIKTKKLHPERNPKFKGYYHTPKGIFQTAKQAAQHFDFSLYTVIARCKEISEQKITKKSLNKSKDFTKSDIGKIYKELGWYFIPKPQ